MVIKTGININFDMQSFCRSYLIHKLNMSRFILSKKKFFLKMSMVIRFGENVQFPYVSLYFQQTSYIPGKVPNSLVFPNIWGQISMNMTWICWAIFSAFPVRCDPCLNINLYAWSISRHSSDQLRPNEVHRIRGRGEG